MWPYLVHFGPQLDHFRKGVRERESATKREKERESVRVREQKKREREINKEEKMKKSEKYRQLERQVERWKLIGRDKDGREGKGNFYLLLMNKKPGLASYSL